MSTQHPPTPQDPSPENPSPPGPVIETKEADHMVYKDSEGVEHAIRIPAGQLQLACQYFMDEDWEALGRFPLAVKTG